MGNFIYSKAPQHNKNIPIISDFKFIREFGHEKYMNINPESLLMHYNKGIEICYVEKGKYNWQVENEKYTVLPGEGFITCPWQMHGSQKGVLDIGEIWWLIITPDIFTKDRNFSLGSRNHPENKELQQAGKVLSTNNNPVLKKAGIVKQLFQELNTELLEKPLGYKTRVYHIIDDIIIHVARMINSRNIEKEIDSEWMKALEELIKSDISKKWNVEKLAKHFGMGTTSFNDKVKRLTGYTPQSLIISFRIDAARNKLSENKQSITGIALDCGFYSSQHFSSSFSKWTGESPIKYRKRKQNTK